MAIKVKTMWKVIMGVVVSLLAGSATGGKQAMAGTSGKDQPTKRTQPSSESEKGTQIVSPGEGVAKKLAPSKGAAKKISPAEGVATNISPVVVIKSVVSTPGEGRGIRFVPADEAALIWRSINRSSAEMVLPQIQEIPMVRSEDLSGWSDSEKPVIIMENDRSGYLRIPIKVYDDEDALIKEYEQSR